DGERGDDGGEDREGLGGGHAGVRHRGSAVPRQFSHPLSSFPRSAWERAGATLRVARLPESGTNTFAPAPRSLARRSGAARVPTQSVGTRRIGVPRFGPIRACDCESRPVYAAPTRDRKSTRLNSSHV